MIYLFVGIMLLLLVWAFFAGLEQKKQDDKAFIDDYRKWAQLEVDRIINADTNKNKTLF